MIGNGFNCAKLDFAFNVSTTYLLFSITIWNLASYMTQSQRPYPKKQSMSFISNKKNLSCHLE